MAKSNAGRPGPRRSVPFPAPQPNGRPHRHVVPADPGWWAIVVLPDGPSALPVMSWEVIPATDDEDAPMFEGLVPFGFGMWEWAECLRGFTDYVYSPASPTMAEIRKHIERIVNLHPDFPSDGEDGGTARLRAWLERPSA